MRSLIAVLAGLLALGSTTSLAAQQELRIAYIDSQAILQEAPGAAEAQQQFDQQMQQFGEEIEVMGQELDSLITAYQQQQGTLSTEVRETRETEIRQREIQYQQRLDEMEQEAAQRREELVQPILSRMSTAIEQIRSEGSYSVIFDVAGQSIIAADPSLDLTMEVIQRLQEMAGADEM